MRNKLFLLLAAMLMTVGIKAANKEVYTAFDSKTGVLTYYFDDQYEARAAEGKIVEMYTSVSNPDALRFKDYHDQVKKAVIDKSMQTCGSWSLANLFYGGYEIQGNYVISYNLSNMTQISGMENLFTGYAEDMTGMFRGCSALTTIDLSRFSVHNVTSMYEMFCDCKSLETLDLSSFNTKKVTDMTRMFKNCSSLKSLDVRPLYTANVKYMEGLFAGCSSLVSLDLRMFDTGKLKYPASMFEGCTSLQTIYCYDNWNIISGLEDTSNMFAGCTSLVGDKGTKCDGETHTDKSYARPDLGEKQPGYFTKKAGKEVYTLFDAGTGTLTYYCDNIYAGRKAMGDIVELYDPADIARFEGYNTKVKKAVIDESMKDTLLTSMKSMFYGGHNFELVSLEEISGMTNLITDEVTDMSYMFYGCESLKSLYVNWFNTAKVTDMSEMFRNCYSLKSIDVSRFNTAKVTNMNSMFRWCKSLKTLDVSSFNTANVTDMSSMFFHCKSLKTLDLRHFNTSKVKDFSNMFSVVSSLTTILCNDDWSKNPNVENSKSMFYYCGNLKGRRGTSYDEDHITIEYARPDGVGGPGYFTNVAETYSVFDEQTGTLTYYYDGIRAGRNGICEFYEPDGNYVSHFEGYADQIKKAVIDQSFKYAPCTSLAAMFYGGNNDKTLSALETIEGLENINYAEVTSMYCMFKGCSSLKEISLYPFYDAVNVTEMSNMFEDCKSLQTLDLRYLLNTSKVTSMFRMFAGCSKLQKVLISSLNTANVTDMGGMFDGCSSLTALDLRSFNTENVEWMSYMFRDCYSLKSLDLRSFNTAHVQSFASMFEGCSSLTTLDLRSFNTAKVQDMDYMFNGCWALTSILNLDDWSNNVALTMSTGMFYGCSSLMGDKGTAWDENNTDHSYARLDGGVHNPGYFSTMNEVYTVFDMSTQTLTYYCDDQRFNRQEQYVELYDPYDHTTPRFRDYHEDVTKIVMDESMRGALLTSMRSMFAGGGEFVDEVYVTYKLNNVEEIEGLDYLNTANVTDMSGLFAGCESLKELDLLLFNFANVTNTAYMFSGCESLHQIFCNEDFNSNEAISNSESMFQGCTYLIGARNTMCDGENHIDKEYGHPDGGNENPGYFTPRSLCYTIFDEQTGTLTYYFDDDQSIREGILEYYTPEKGHDIARFKGYADQIKTVVIDKSMRAWQPKSLANLFDGVSNALTALETIKGLSNINSCKATDMYAMFRNCSALKELDITPIYTGNVKNFAYMFYGCSAIEELDVTQFIITFATNMSSMFANCSSLKTLRGRLDWSKHGMPADDMFFNCISLVGRAGTQCNGKDKIANMLARPDRGENDPGYFTQPISPASPGHFTINEDGGMVEFSPGNLQFSASGQHACADGTTQKGTWRFAPNQWDMIGNENNSKISENYSGWIDLFGWATSGWNSGANAYQPWATSTNYEDYLDKDIEFEEEFFNGDWGIYNQIGSEAVPGNWHMLNTTEWKYLLNNRPYAGNLRGHATVNGVNGYILLPDDWQTPACLDFYWGTEEGPGTHGWTSNIYYGKDWEEMEKAGAIFLPAAGWRNGTAATDEERYGYYWCDYSSPAYGFYFFFDNYDASTSRGYYNSYGRSVRLVKGFEPKPDITSDYKDPQADLLNVTITSINESANIWYKVLFSDKRYDGGDVSDLEWKEYTGTINIDPQVDFGETTFVTVFAYAQNQEGVSSAIAAEEYEFAKPKAPKMPSIVTNYSSPLDESILVTLTAEEGMKIYYQTFVGNASGMGLLPDPEAWQKYNEPFTVFPETDFEQTKYITIFAYAESADGLQSDVAKTECIFSKPAQPAKPSINFTNDGQSESVTITISAGDYSQIWYKTSISGETIEPGDEDGWESYKQPVTVNLEVDYGETKVVTVMAYAEDEGAMSDFEIGVYEYSKPEKPEMPVITSDYQGLQSESATITVTAQEGATVYYAVMKLAYDENGKLIDSDDYSKLTFEPYDKPIEIVPEGDENANVAYKVVAYAAKDGVQSDFATEIYEFFLPELLDAPVITSDYKDPKADLLTVTVTSEEGAKIMYAVIITDKEPGGNDLAQAEWKEYKEPFTVSPETDFGQTKTVTILAYAEKNNVQSATATQVYEFSKPEKPAVPVITSDYNDPQAESVTITVSVGEGATAWYKVIVSDQKPSEKDIEEAEWKEYSEPFTVLPETGSGQTKFVTVIAYAEKDGVQSESVQTSYEFIQPEPVVCPDFMLVDEKGEPVGETLYAVLGEPFAAPTVKLLTDGYQFSVSYSSSNEEVAAINDFGEIELVGAGETVITANVFVEGISQDVCNFGYLTYILQVDKPAELEPLPADVETTFDFSVYDPSGSEIMGLTLGVDDRFNEEEGRIEVATTNTAEEIDAKLEEAFEGSSSLKNLLPGTITFELPEGEGTIEIDCQTIPGYILKVRIAEYGEAYVTSTIEQAMRGKATINYSVAQRTFVVIYLEGVNKNSAPARIATSNKEEGAGAYVYSIKITPKKATTGIDHLNGQELNANGEKLLIDGVLYIERNGKRYDATGAQVK